VNAELEDRGSAFTLSLPRRISLPADGRPVWMPVDAIAARGESKLVAIPKERLFVFQVVQLKNPAPYPLLEGRVEVVRKGSFVGHTLLRYTAPGEPMEVSLGIDEELRVERKPISELDRGPGVLSSTKHLEKNFRIQLRNGAKTALPVELRENIPVSKIEAVRVELDRGKTTRGFELDDERGLLRWRLKVERGAEAKVDLFYTIHLPDSWDLRLNGR
jgi:uncharacterized protein (TIGR02231 family)